jgi:enoyl-CoA hydratase/carnithine racemase
VSTPQRLQYSLIDIARPSASATKASGPETGEGPPLKIAHLVLDHPAKRNALAPALLSGLCEVIEQAARDGARAAVLSGAGSTFSAGYDITALPEEPDGEWLRGHGPLAAALRCVSQGPLPVIAALNGAAIGAGCELALACDLRVAHPGVRLQMPPVRLGLIYTPEGVARLIALCGLGRARELLLTAQPIEAGAALQCGLLSRVVPEERLLETAFELARQVAELPPQAVQGTRILIESLILRGGGGAGPGAGDDGILKLREAAWRSPEARAARAAFRSRRK